MGLIGDFSCDVGAALLKIDSHYGGRAVGLTNRFFKRYLALTESQRGVVRDVVGEFKTAGVVQNVSAIKKPARCGLRFF